MPDAAPPPPIESGPPMVPPAESAAGRLPIGWKLLFALGAAAFVLALVFDDEISKFITSHRPEKLDPFVILITSWKCEVAILLVLSTGILALRRRNALLFTWGTFLVGEVIGTAIKYGVGRRRPYIAHDVIENLVEESTPSFPSNHSLALYTVAFALGWCFPKLRGVALAWATLIAFTRIYVGVHYTSDVLGGAFLAVGLVWLAKRHCGEWARRTEP
ncbi:MAG: phosphatase PAP2 family protein [Planctomycetes bacterium]|nr:phosphatase PAP2 family protein [Planctomycetota bacterium]